MGELLRLAELCKAATGPDRELDGLIFRALNPDGDFHQIDGVWHMRDIEDHGAFEAPPHFTSSRDAAMSIVPDYAFEQVSSGYGTLRAFAQLVYARHTRRIWGRGRFRPPSIYVVAASEPLALCAASLRARTSEDNSHG